MSSGLTAFVPMIVIPVFNEAETISEVVAAARAHAPVLVVDDGSEDGGAAAARAAGADLLRRARHRAERAAGDRDREPPRRAGCARARPPERDPGGGVLRLLGERAQARGHAVRLPSLPGRAVRRRGAKARRLRAGDRGADRRSGSRLAGA